MEMRKLLAMDLFPLLNIIAKIGIKDLIKKFFEQRAEASKSEHKNLEEIGQQAIAELLEILLMNIGRAREEINALLADLCGVEKSEIEKLPMDEYMGLLMNFFTQPEFMASLNAIISSFK
jgi:membrane protease subunit (stomatin/prohibitin family)